MVGRRIWHLTIAAVTPGMGQRPGYTSFRPESGHRWGMYKALEQAAQT